MTSPLHMEFSKEESSMSFVMPSSFSEEKLPRPNDPAVKIEKTEDVYMAAEAFSDTETAGYLNNNYICIKVDREQRPDIDQYLMNFIQTQTGSGGWPLNVFLTPDGRPVVAVTYAPAESDENRMSFREIAGRVKEYLKSESNAIPVFNLIENEPSTEEESMIAREVGYYYDDEYAGFGVGQKFPPHSILLFLLHFLSVKDDDEIRKIVTTSLDAIMLGGLNDHLQGGIFRYCVDRKWTIPHFEKMLYDQALALWTYSLGYKVTGNQNYRTMAERILKCLDECFEDNGLYVSAFNADTDHQEGLTYLWSRSEIEDIPGKEDFYNINALLCNDLVHVYTTKMPLSWKDLPANSIQKSGEPETDCYNKICRIL